MTNHSNSTQKMNPEMQNEDNTKRKILIRLIIKEVLSVRETYVLAKMNNYVYLFAFK